MDEASVTISPTAVLPSLEWSCLVIITNPSSDMQTKPALPQWNLCLADKGTRQLTPIKKTQAEEVLLIIADEVTLVFAKPKL